MADKLLEEVRTPAIDEHAPKRHAAVV